MKQHTTSGAIDLEATDHLVQPLIAHAEQRPDSPLLAYRDGDRFVDVSAAEVWRRVQALARGLIGLGVSHGDRVAIMSQSRIEWMLLDYAILAAGGVTVPIYETSSAEQVTWIISDSGVRIAIANDQTLAGAFTDVISDLDHLLYLEDDAFERIHAAGEDVDDTALKERLDGLRTDDLATIIYTSGTTGRPKGCRLTHHNLRWDAVNALAVIGDLIRPEDSNLLFLPMAHSFAKILAMATVERGARLGFASSTDRLIEEFPLFRPEYIAAVPRIFEKVFTTAEQRAHAEGKGRIFDLAVDVAERYSRERSAGRVSTKTRLAHAVFDRLVYGKLRDVFGGRLRSACSGGGPLSARLAHFFTGIGLEVYEGYGLTETSPVLTVNAPGANRIGTVGKPLPGTTIAIAADGEVLARGPQIFPGYHHDEQATREAIDDDGWFHTGDIGDLDDDGFLSITGRKKELIVTAAGKNVAPAVLEGRIKHHPLVSQAMVVGDNRKFVAALITIDEEVLPGWAERHGKDAASIDDLLADPDVYAEVEQAVANANAAVSRAESVREFRILPRDFSIDGGELTPTLKVKRRIVEDRYADVIADIYGD